MSATDHDLSESNIVFIHSALDDAGLSPAAFRVYCHLARRTLHSRMDKWPSAPAMAKVCRVHKDTVWKALKELIERGMIERESRTNTTSRHIITSPTKWTKERVGGKEGSAENEGRPTAENEGRPPAESKGHEGNPEKVIQGRTAGGASDTPAVRAFFDLEPSAKRDLDGGEKKSTGKTEKARNLPFDALMAVDGVPLDAQLTKPEAGRIVGALKAIRGAWPALAEEHTAGEKHADDVALAAEIATRAAIWRTSVFPHATCTSTALAAHWTKCAPHRAATVPVGQPLSTGSKYPLPADCDFHALGRALGLRIAFDTPWIEVSHESKAKILEAHAAAQQIS